MRVDAITVDLQHGMFGVESAIACLQAISATPATPLVRCRSNDAEDIGHRLDAGAYGVICAVDGLDAIYVGPNDLALSSGWTLLGAELAPDGLVEALQHIVGIARAAGVPAGIFAPTGEHAVQLAEWGYQLITPGNDVGLIRAESARRIAMLRPPAVG